MPAARTPLKKLKDKDTNERNAQRRGPKPKSLEEQNLLQVPVTVKSIKEVERSYMRAQKIQVLMWRKHYRLRNNAPNTAVKMRPPTLDECSVYFQIPKSTIACWTHAAVKIIESEKQSRQASPTVFLCMWPEMEVKLFDAFVARRELGRQVRDSWFISNFTFASRDSKGASGHAVSVRRIMSVPSVLMRAPASCASGVVRCAYQRVRNCRTPPPPRHALSDTS